MLKLQQIVKDYQAGDTTVHALRGVSLQFRESEFVAILGHSGCGKTTLLNILGGMDRLTSGHVLLAGEDVSGFEHYRRVGSVHERRPCHQWQIDEGLF